MCTSSINYKIKNFKLKRIMELKHTVSLMLSSDYKERFIAEYLQVKIRYEKLLAMCKKWDEGNLPFTPTCSRQVYTDQLNHMKAYLSILEARAITEGIDLSEETLVHRTDYVPRVKELFESHEVCTSIDKFLEGIMWLGMELKRVNEPNPYPNSKDPSTGTRDSRSCFRKNASAFHSNFAGRQSVGRDFSLRSQSWTNHIPLQVIGIFKERSNL